MCNKFDGHPKGFAYIEFAERDSVQTAMAMDESMFRGRQIKVMPKRTNRPGLSVTNRYGKYRNVACKSFNAKCNDRTITLALNACRGPRGARGYRGMARGIIRGSAYFGYRPTRRPRYVSKLQVFLECK